MVPSTASTGVVPIVHDASVEVRDGAEEVRPQDPKSKEPVEDKVMTERQSQEEVNASSESTTNNTNNNSGSITTSIKAKKNRAKIPAREARQAQPSMGYTNEANMYPTYSQGSSDSDSWNEYDGYHTQGNHIYLHDNESVSVLTKEFRDPNIMDVLSLDAVMEVVNKGILAREDGDVTETRRHGDGKGEDETSMDRIMNSLWNALDCCGDSGENFVSDRRCYVDRCHRGSSGGYGCKVGFNDDRQYFGHRQKNKRNGAGTINMKRIEEEGNAINREVGGKSVSWADDTVDNIVLDGSFKEDDIDEDNKPSTKQHFNRSRSNSSDGKGSKASSVRSAVKSSLKNVKNMFQCATTKQPVDADTVYEQYRNALVAGTNQDSPNWRDMVNDSNNDPNWRAAVNDRLNYQGPNSPVSSNGGGWTPVGGTPSPQHQQQYNMSPTPMTVGMPPNNSPPPAMAMNGRVPSMGNRSVVSNMMNMSLSVDSEDIGDKYGMKEEEDALRPMASNFGNYGATNNASMHYGSNSQYSQYPSQQLRNQESVMGENECYNDGYRAVAGNNTMQMNPSYDPRMNQARQDYSYGSSNNMPPQQQYHNEMAQQPHEHFGASMPQQNMNHPPMTNGMMQGYDHQHQHPMPPQPPSSPQRTFMA